MTDKTPTPDALTALMAKWREFSDLLLAGAEQHPANESSLRLRAADMRQCADELSALLAAPVEAGYVPWRLVTRVECRDDNSTILHLECGHMEMWPFASSTPAATKCCTCDPPTFHGQPFKHPLLTHLEPALLAAPVAPRAQEEPVPDLRVVLEHVNDRIGTLINWDIEEDASPRFRHALRLVRIHIEAALRESPASPDAGAPATPEPDELEHSWPVMSDDMLLHIKVHWFTQGGEAEFGSIDEANNADELVAAILRLVRMDANAAESSPTHREETP